MGDCGRMWLKVEGGGRIMFMSEYSHSIDSKGRMILPAKFREELGDHFVLAPGLDSCLCIYTMEHWNNLISKFEQMSATHQNVRKACTDLSKVRSANRSKSLCFAQSAR